MITARDRELLRKKITDIRDETNKIKSYLKKNFGLDEEIKVNNLRRILRGLSLEFDPKEMDSKEYLNQVGIKSNPTKKPTRKIRYKIPNSEFREIKNKLIILNQTSRLSNSINRALNPDSFLGRKMKNKTLTDYINFILKGGKEETTPKDKGTHKMPDGTVMTGRTHSKDSKPVKETPIKLTSEECKKEAADRKLKNKNKPKNKKPIDYCFRKKNKKGCTVTICVPKYV